MTRRHKVMWVIKGLGAGGAERLLVDALPYIDRSTFEYEVAYLLPGKNDFVPDLKAGGIPTHCLDVQRSWDPRAITRLAGLVRERDISLVHAHLPFAGLVARLAVKLARVRGLVYTEHNVLSCYNPAIHLMDRLTYRMDDATIAVSDGVAKSAAAWPLARPSRLSTISNGIGVEILQREGPTQVEVKESLGIPAGNMVVGNVAHIRPEKGHEYLLEAIRQVKDRVPNVTCVVIGREKESGDLARLERKAGDLGVRDNFIFTGFRTDARDLIRGFDVFVLSSLHEGLPIALLEAMAVGKTPVVTGVGGVPEVVSDGVEGYVVQPRNPAALADRIVKVLQDDSLRARMSRASAETVDERFGMKRMVREVEQIYLDVLQRNGVAVSGAADAAVVG